jgi:hypothetical protein
MADNSLTSHTFVPKFDGFYDHWAMLMENLLQSKEIWSSIDPGVTVVSYPNFAPPYFHIFSIFTTILHFFRKVNS